jgi:hypothetical protein
MQTLILDRDLKTLFSGVAVAAAVGLLMGGVMQPDLRGSEEAEGPQILLAGGGPRSETGGGSTYLAAYQGKVPDYVVGTDWTKPAAPAVYPEIPLEAETVVYTSEADLDPPARVPAPLADEPRPPTEYASTRGGWAYEANLPAPPPPPAPARGCRRGRRRGLNPLAFHPARR